jgi:hypothetical protein
MSIIEKIKEIDIDEITKNNLIILANFIYSTEVYVKYVYGSEDHLINDIFLYHGNNEMVIEIKYKADIRINGIFFDVKKLKFLFERIEVYKMTKLENIFKNNKIANKLRDVSILDI